MTRLLKIELIKILSYSTFWVLSGITLGIYFFFLLIGSQINFNFDGIDINVYFRFPTVWQSIAYYSSWFNLLLALLIIILTGNEFNFRTFRQNTIDGLTRQELFLSKLIIIILFALVAFLISFFSALSIGVIYTKDLTITSVFIDIYFVFSYFIQAVGFMSIALLISLLLKNIAASIVVFIGAYVFELIIRAYFAITSISLGQYLPFNVFSDLCGAPSFNKMITNPLLQESLTNSPGITQTGSPVFEISYGINIILALSFILLFFYFSYRILAKRDL
ncbi:MAG: hypothetical protein ABFS35_08690 [Bacteroidota bacterium]